MAKDILIGLDEDLSILSGDLDVGYSDEQHIEDILTASKGEYKQSPLVGVSIADYLMSPMASTNIAKLEREILLQLESDGATEITVKMGTELKIQASYGD